VRCVGTSQRNLNSAFYAFFSISLLDLLLVTLVQMTELAISLTLRYSGVWGRIQHPTIQQPMLPHE
jgi:hypothetical protein